MSRPPRGVIGRIFSKELRAFWIFEAIYFSVIGIVNIWADEFNLYFRWFFIGDITPYALVPAIIVSTLGIAILYKTVTDKRYVNFRYYSFGVFFLGLFFFWSWYMDMTVEGDGRVSPYNGRVIGYSSRDWVRTYSLLLIIGGFFIVLWFLHFEYLYWERVYARRLITVMIGILPAATLYFNKRVTGDFSFSENYFENITFLMYLILGLGFFSIFAMITTLRGRMDFGAEELKKELDIQLAFTVGILQAMSLFALVEGFRLIYNKYIDPAHPTRISLHAPVTVTFFMVPLIYLYFKNPAYLTALAIPVYEVMIIDLKTSINLWGKALREGEHTKTSSSLKTALLTSISIMFGEITGVETYVKNIQLSTGDIILKKFILESGREILLALITKRKSRYLNQVVDMYISELNSYLSKKDIVQNLTKLDPEDISFLNTLTDDLFSYR